MLVIIAAVMAIGFSAFTGAPEKEVNTYFWFNDLTQQYVPYQGTQNCPVGQEEVCIVRDIPGHPEEVLLKSEDKDDPLMYNP